MAIKGDRIHVRSDISFFINTVSERGGIVSIVTAGSGAAMDQGVAVVGYQSQQVISPVPNASGFRPIGILMCDVVNLDLTRQHRNWHKEEVQVGSKATIWDIGEVTTNMLIPGITIAAGDPAFLGPSGLITNVDIGAIASPIVGFFKSKKNEDGYAKVSISLPQSRS
jgi:hypothetical protein